MAAALPWPMRYEIPIISGLTEGVVDFTVETLRFFAIPAVFKASETFDVGMDTSSPVADDYFDRAPFEFEGTLNKLYFKYLPVGQPAFVGSPDDD